MYLILIGSPALTNRNKVNLKMGQSNVPHCPLTSIKTTLDLLEPENEFQKMLHEKMMMDPVISLILFNEYIPLRAPTTTSSAGPVCEKMGGLFLGKSEEDLKSESEEFQEVRTSAESVFIRSELPPLCQENKPTTGGGLFIRSVEETNNSTDDWVIA